MTLILIKNDMKITYLTVAFSLLLIFSVHRINAQDNQKGRTLVVFINNYNYQTLPKIEGPAREADIIRNSLSRYSVDDFSEKENMTKTEMENFLKIELQDLIKSSDVKSLLIWYTGHGRYISGNGYWIPVDARMNDEMTFLDISTVRTVLQGYEGLAHALVVNDASECGPAFYRATRTAIKEISCDNPELADLTSYQVFSSAGFEPAADDSKFAQAFAYALTQNAEPCISIDSIVKSVSLSMAENKSQRIIFGRIAGLTDEGGTFSLKLK